FIGSYVARTTRGAGLGAIDDDDGFFVHAAGEAEDRRAGEGSGLAPGIFFDVVDLNAIDRAAERAAADQIDEAVVGYADNGAIDGRGDVLTARPAAGVRLVNV